MSVNSGQDREKVLPWLPSVRHGHGHNWIFDVGSPWLVGLPDPMEAPLLLRYAGMIILLVIMVFVFNFAAGDAYNQLQERRRKRKKRREEIY